MGKEEAHHAVRRASGLTQGITGRDFAASRGQLQAAEGRENRTRPLLFNSSLEPYFISVYYVPNRYGKLIAAIKINCRSTIQNIGNERKMNSHLFVDFQIKYTNKISQTISAKRYVEMSTFSVTLPAIRTHTAMK